MGNLGTQFRLVAVHYSSSDVGSLLTLALAAIDEAGDSADETEHQAEPDGSEERFNACEHGVSLSAYVRR